MSKPILKKKQGIEQTIIRSLSGDRNIIDNPQPTGTSNHRSARYCNSRNQSKYGTCNNGIILTKKIIII